MTTGEELDLPAFDARATRRAVRRGVVVTAATVLVWLLLLGVVHHGATAMWQMRDNSRFEEVIGPAVEVANPAYKIMLSNRSGGVWFDTTMRVSARARGPRQPATLPDFRVRQDFRGRVDAKPHTGLFPVTRLSRILEDIGHPSKEQTRADLDRLPEAVIASARVDLARPMTPDELVPLRRALRLCGLGARVLENVRRSGGAVSGTEAVEDQCDETWAKTGPVFLEPLPSSGPVRRVSWPDSALGGLQHWAAKLKPMDDTNLHALGLPSAARIQEVARAGLIYSFVVERATPERLRVILDDPAIRAVVIADVDFDAGPTIAEDTL